MRDSISRLAALILAATLGSAGTARALAPGVSTTDSSAAAAGADSLVARGISLPLALRPAGVVVEAGDRRGQVLEPAGIAVDAFGRLYVSDAALHRLQRFEKDGAWLGETGALGSDPGQMRRPGSVTLLGTLSIAVLDVENRRVLAYDLFGRLQGTIVDLGAAALEERVGHVDPVAIAADRGGALYIADAERDRVLAFDFSGRFVRALGGFGARAGSFRGLAGLAIAPRGELVTVERAGARLQRLDAGGRAVGSWSLPVARGRGALAVAVDDSGRVAVADELGGALWLFAADGRRLATIGGLGHPRALAFAPSGDLLVAETRPARVRRFALEPAVQRAPPPGE